MEGVSNKVRTEEVDDANIGWRSPREASKDSGSGVSSSCVMIVITMIVIVMTPFFLQERGKIFFYLLFPVLSFEMRRVLGKTLIVQPQRVGPLLVGIIKMSSIVSIAMIDGDVDAVDDICQNRRTLLLWTGGA